MHIGRRALPMAAQRQRKALPNRAVVLLVGHMGRFAGAAFGGNFPLQPPQGVVDGAGGQRGDVLSGEFLRQHGHGLGRDPAVFA